MTANRLKLLPVVAVVVSALALASCGKLSGKAHRMVGNYYMVEVSNDDPVFELRDDATCLIRAIRPGVLTYCVEGSWNVEGDSLVANLDPLTLEWEGDSTLIGRVARRFTRHIVGVDPLTLTVEQDGINYVYHRRLQ